MKIMRNSIRIMLEIIRVQKAFVRFRQRFGPFKRDGLVTMECVLSRVLLKEIYKSFHCLRFNNPDFDADCANIQLKSLCDK